MEIFIPNSRWLNMATYKQLEPIIVVSDTHITLGPLGPQHQSMLQHFTVATGESDSKTTWLEEQFLESSDVCSVITSLLLTRTNHWTPSFTFIVDSSAH